MIELRSPNNDYISQMEKEIEELEKNNHYNDDESIGTGLDNYYPTMPLQTKQNIFIECFKKIPTNKNSSRSNTGNIY